MSSSSAPIPYLVVKLAWEQPTEILVECTEANGALLADWIAGDRWRALVACAAIEAAQPRRSDGDSGSAALAALTAMLAGIDDPLLPQSSARDGITDPPDATAPMGSYQGWTLRRILATGPAGREWVAWASAQEWPHDADFRAAVREVAEREGLREPPATDDEDGDRA